MVSLCLSTSSSARRAVRSPSTFNFLFIVLIGYCVAANKGHQEDQTVPPMQPGVFEHKYEVDSLAGANTLAVFLNTVYTIVHEQKGEEEKQFIRVCVFVCSLSEAVLRLLVRDRQSLLFW